MVAKKQTSKPSSKKMTNTKPAKTVAKKTVAQTKPVQKQTVKTTNGKKGLLNFLFSFNGNISKELFLGTSFMLTVTMLIIQLIIMLTAEINVIALPLKVIMLIVAIMMISIGYKRAHSLGISGFYSLVGTVICKPFFAFFAPANDMANDNQYTPSFTRAKKIGAFFGKTMGRQLLYIILLVCIALIPYIVMSLTVPMEGSAPGIKFITNFIIYLAGFNILQIILLNTTLLQKYYRPIVKVLSFFAYNIALITITVAVYATYIMLAMFNALSAM